MPAWLIQVLVTLAVKFGLPWLMQKFPWIPEVVRKEIEDLIKKLSDHKDQKKVIVEQAKANIAKCYGDSCKI